MLERIRAICDESSWLLDSIVVQDFIVEIAIRWVRASLDDLEASDNPTENQIEEVFIALDNLKNKLIESLSQIPARQHPMIENLTDRIDIFLFHHRL